MLTLPEFADLILKGLAEQLTEIDYLKTYLEIPLGDSSPLSEKTALGEVIKQGKNSVARAFIQYEPACVHATNCYGQTPLYEAIATNNIELIKLLYENDADLEYTYETPYDEYSKVKSPLFHAMQYANATTIKYLLQLKPNISLEPNPLLAVSCLYSGAKIEPLIDAGVVTNFIDIRGRTALHRAAMWGDTAAIQVLCSKGHCNINQLDITGHTALDYAKHFTDPANQKSKESVLRNYGAAAAKNVVIPNYSKTKATSKKPHNDKPYERAKLKKSYDSSEESSGYSFAATKENRYQPQNFKPLQLPLDEPQTNNDATTALIKAFENQLQNMQL